MGRLEEHAPLHQTVSTCKHEHFAAEVAVQRLGEGDDVIKNFVAEIQIKCSQCDQPFHFVGPGAGFSFSRPTVNVGATTLHAPIRPGQAEPPSSLRFEVRK